MKKLEVTYYASKGWITSPAVREWRDMVRNAVRAAGASFVVLDDDEIGEWCASAKNRRRLLLVGGEAALQSVIDAGPALSNVWPIVFPRTKRSWESNSAWVSTVQNAPPMVAGYVTDSEESKDELESTLSSQRVEIVVIPPVLDRFTGDRIDSDGGLPVPVVGDDDDEFMGLDDMFVSLNSSLPETWSFSGEKVRPSDTSRVREGWQSFGESYSEAAPMGSQEDDGTDLWPQGFSHDDVNSGVDRLLSYAPIANSSKSVGIIGTQLTFIDQLAGELRGRFGLDVAMDEWTHLSAPPPKSMSPALMKNSDVIIAEWVRPNNVWIQEHARKDQRLIVRAHRYEVTTKFPFQTDMTKYSAGVVIAPWVGRVLVQKYAWPAEKMVYIPNFVDKAHFAREKLDGAEFTLGMVGIRPDLKRFDLALDLLEELRAVDLRYSLRVRSALPPDHVNWLKLDRMRIQWGHSLQRIKQNPLLRSAVHFDEPGRDMSRWYRQIGIILSLSDLEGSHVALAEGIASGALPIARNWPGISTLWPREIISRELGEAVSSVLEFRDPHERARHQRRNSKLKTLRGDRVLAAWEMLINGDISGAQNEFGPIDWWAEPYTPVT